ncbi:MAG TPA: hypothetical protein DER60_13540 [Syntrophomonas sp.]|jgi:hypothetical protein|nr:hypothetical protein [Syntrophomonas sp.]
MINKMKRVFISGLVVPLMLFAVGTSGLASAAQGDDDVREKLRNEGVWLTPEESAQQKAELDSLLDSLDSAADMLESMPALSVSVQINGSLVNAPADMDVVEGQVMVPIRWAAEQLGASAVEWDAATRTIAIETGQDFYSMEKLASYSRGLKISTEELESRIWPLPEKVENLQIADLVSDRKWILELKEYKARLMDPALAPDPVNICIASDDGRYEHSSLIYSIDNRQGHYYLPMDWLEYLFKARVHYDQAANLLSIQTPDVDLIKSEIARLENALIPSSPDEAVKLWGRGEQTRNGALQYLALSPQLRQEADASDYVRQSYWVTGMSSPWVGPITIVSQEQLSDTEIEYTLSFPEMTSSPPHTTATEKLMVEKLIDDGGGGWFITRVLQSSDYGIIDGPKHYIRHDVDGGGKYVTAQITVNHLNNQWELTVTKDDSEAAVEIFKGDNKGFDVSTIAAAHIISPDTVDFLLVTDYRSMPFGGCGYELYSLKDAALAQIDLSTITHGTPFSIHVDEVRRSAEIESNGAVAAVPLSDWDMHGYQQYGNEFCQNFFISMDLQSVDGEALPEIVTTEVIAATLPHHLTYLHTTYKYVNGAWKIEQTDFSDQPSQHI